MRACVSVCACVCMCVSACVYVFVGACMESISLSRSTMLEDSTSLAGETLLTESGKGD